VKEHGLFTAQVVWWLGPIPITVTVLTSAAISVAFLLTLALWARAATTAPTSAAAAVARMVARFLQELVAETAGSDSAVLEAFAAALFVFIAGSAVVGQLPGVAAPTSNLPAASALAFLVFLAVPIAGIKQRGLKRYLAEYLRPNPLLLPLHVISELSRTVALALRLFGNMMSGHLVVSLIVALVGVFVPVPLMALDLLIGFLQAYIFTVLACVYVGAAIRMGDTE
jgi:F-type H+-transporting ATPase subunit a